MFLNVTGKTRLVLYGLAIQPVPVLPLPVPVLPPPCVLLLPLSCLIHPFPPPSFSYAVRGLVRLNLSLASALHKYLGNILYQHVLNDKYKKYIKSY